MKFSITLTWSKIVAVLVLASAVYLDLTNMSNVFTYSLPFVVFLITGKQFIDLKKNGTQTK
ncbi:hypothetical protein ES704_03656 [subsurface metagenome]|jgi:hypothetical protein